MNEAYLQGYFKGAQDNDWQAGLKKFYTDNRDAVNAAGGGALGGLLYLLSGGRGLLGGLASSGAGAGVGYFLGQAEPTPPKAPPGPNVRDAIDSVKDSVPDIFSEGIMSPASTFRALSTDVPLGDATPGSRAVDTAIRTAVLARYTPWLSHMKKVHGQPFGVKVPFLKKLAPKIVGGNAKTGYVKMLRTPKLPKPASQLALLTVMQQAAGVGHGFLDPIGATRGLKGDSIKRALLETALDPLQQGRNIGAVVPLALSVRANARNATTALEGSIRVSKQLGFSVAKRMMEDAQKGLSRESILSKYDSAIKSAILPTKFLERFNQVVK
jgi:hypothetical protein